MDSFILMHKDVEVAKFFIQKDQDEKEFLHVTELYNDLELPVGTKRAKEDIDTNITCWNNNRCIPLERPNFLNLLKDYNVKTQCGLIPYSHLCSLTDNYWFKSKFSKDTWKDVNFRDNNLNSSLYKSLILDINDKELPSLLNPDITTDGAISKFWVKSGDSFVLLKSSFGSLPMESFKEIISSEILSELKISHVNYKLKNIQGKIFSACPCFITDDNCEFVPAENAIFDYYDSTNDYLIKMKDLGFSEEIDNMIFADMIIGNMDRHARNYGQIIDSDTQEIVKLAPLFDHGGCTFVYDLSKQIYKPTQTLFEDALISLPIKQLEKIDNIDINKISELVYSLPINENIQTRIISGITSRIEDIYRILNERNYYFDRTQ